MCTEIKTPHGKLHLYLEGEAIICACFDKERKYWEDKLALNKDRTTHLTTKKLELAIKSYFDGDFSSLKKIELAPRGTAFQKKVWKKLRQIPAGKTKSYLEIAQACKTPKASRAVGSACGANPLILFTPCHRVIASDGSLGGFSAGLGLKKKLLAHEEHKKH